MSQKAWIDVLRCPKCKGELVQSEYKGTTGLLCVSEDLLFPIRDGMPIMLIEQAVSVNEHADES